MAPPVNHLLRARCAHLVAQGKTLAEIADELSRNPDSVRGLLKRMGLEIKPAPDHRTLQAFWHRTRKCCVPLMSHEAVQRLGISPHQLTSRLQRSQNLGHIVRVTIGADEMFQLTPEGEAIVTARNVAERSGAERNVVEFRRHG